MAPIQNPYEQEPRRQEPSQEKCVVSMEPCIRRINESYDEFIERVNKPAPAPIFDKRTTLVRCPECTFVMHTAEAVTTCANTKCLHTFERDKNIF